MLTENPTKYVFPAYFESIEALTLVCVSIQWCMLYFILAAMIHIKRVAVFGLLAKLAECTQSCSKDRVNWVNSVQEPLPSAVQTCLNSQSNSSYPLSAEPSEVNFVSFVVPPYQHF